MTGKDIRARLEYALAPHWQKVEAPLIGELVEAFLVWYPTQETLHSESNRHVALLRFLISRVNEAQQTIDRLKRDYGEFNKRYARAVLAEEKQRHILDFAVRLGADRRQIKGDRQAFGRWFGHDAVADRYYNRVARAERRLAFYLQRIGVIAGQALRDAGTDAEPLWRQLGLEALLTPLLTYAGDARIRIETFACLANALRQIPASMQSRSINDFTLQYVFRAATDPRQHIWIQCEALNLLASLALDAFAAAAGKRIEQPRAGDDLFVRRRTILLIGKKLAQRPALIGLLQTASRDPSPYVRQALAETLTLADDDSVIRLLPALLREDAIAQVRAATTLQIAKLLERPALADPLRAWLTAQLQEEGDPFVIKTALAVIGQAVTLPAMRDDSERRRQWAEYFMPQIEVLHLGSPHLPIRRFAALTQEQLWCLCDDRRRQLLEDLQEWLRRCPPGRSIRLPSRLLLGWDEAEIGRILAVASQYDFGLDLKKTWTGWRLWRGHMFRRRLWRMLHEFRHPSPDKRQGFLHTLGRVFHGSHRAPSAILAELAETKVPGEPLHFASEGGWRPYLPLVDEFLSALDQRFPVRPVSIHSAEGVTEITPPCTLLGRLRAALKLSWRFQRYAHLRNWHEDGRQPPDAYLRAMSQLGFTVRFQAYGSAPDAHVQRFFPAGLVLGSGEFDWWPGLRDYFFSVFENTLPELVMFTAAALLAFLLRHLYLNRQIHRARARIPLVIGGWGTRGKSGTERIKAALFNALGYSVVSKTTGCEAMFLHGPAYGQLREMFLFRPYDKATIWEQHNVVRLASQLDGEVFLWECMALTPAFVRLLQRRWMHDDFSTITNTFPDHEDLQGPAGINIPEVMTNFIPERGRLLTSEEQMRPILSEAARQLGTPLRGVGWLESGLLAPDVLARFPYQEHPDNIALVLALADELGIAQDFAVKEMADRVVPDLGVLKVYPTATLNTRRLEFVNGMSANERFGCLGNWQRTGFASHDMEAEPGVMLSAVVNNRADRVARSQVFAGILVEDISADLIVLIGSNLHGLQGYIRESWQNHAAGLSLWPADGATPAQALADIARRMRVVHKVAHAKARLAAMLAGCGIGDGEHILAVWDRPAEMAEAIRASGSAEADAIIACVEQDRLSLTEYAEFAQRIAAPVATSARDATLDPAFRDLLWRWLERRILVVEDYYASGNQIIDIICRATPPGFKNRIQGIQNIKGTGLDFVYRWQAWDTCYRACALLQSPEPEVARQGLAALASFQEFGLLCEEHIKTVIATVNAAPEAQSEHFLSELNIIAAHLDRAMQEVRKQMTVTRASGWQDSLFSGIESFLDAGDAIKRRKISNRIYRDMINERISHARAALELQALNKRQKGGWLLSALQQWKKRRGGG